MYNITIYITIDICIQVGCVPGEVVETLLQGVFMSDEVLQGSYHLRDASLCSLRGMTTATYACELGGQYIVDFLQLSAAAAAAGGSGSGGSDSREGSVGVSGGNNVMRILSAVVVNGFCILMGASSIMFR